MADTKRTLRHSDAVDKRRGLYLVDRVRPQVTKPRALEFSKPVKDEILFRFRKSDPCEIARELSSPIVRVSTTDINQVIRRVVWPDMNGDKAA